MPTITEIAAGSEDFSILVAALGFVDDQIADANLVATLGDPDGDFTVFAPTNAAFGALAADLGFEGDTADTDAVTSFLTMNVPAETLLDVLTYHVAGSSLTAMEIMQAGTVTTLQGGTVTLDAPTLVDNEPDLIDPSLVTTDVAADNGVIHVIDRVLLPVDLPGNHAETITGIVAASGGQFDDNGQDFDLLLAAVGVAGLAEALDDPNADLTAFAPNDAAFIGLAQLLGYPGADEAGALAFIQRGLNLLSAGDPVPLLTDILLYHVAGESLQASQVLARTEITTLQGGDITVDGTTLQDLDPELPDPSIIATDIQAANGIVHVIDGVLIPVDVLASDGSMDVDLILGDETAEDIDTGDDNDLIDAAGGNDSILAGDGNDIVLGMAGNDRILGEDGNDMLRGGDGLDILNGGDGDDDIMGGGLSDTIVAGDGNDTVSGDDGNDLLFGQDGDDVISGGLGSDHVAGQDGNDVLSGGAISDELFGNAGDDFLNGGTGFDRLNGGEGADRFFHAGTESHGTDWIQDFSNGDGDMLIFGGMATADDFVVHSVHTDLPERPGDDAVEEIFVDYQGQVIFALVDGAANDAIMLRTADGTEFDLLS
ncbi:fasciclin domain-containing protein [Lutimaribacter marinistellae]|uniref:Fasciclin domain-containing protein n=1 Tax=Lutimaribacter marinistellae TaxID=1820329 RepID=A0ABV7TI07_9RHOB